MAKTYYLETAILNHVTRGAAGGTAYVQPSTVYVGLLASDPGKNGSQASEVSPSGGSAYARQPCTFGAPTNNTDDSQVVNSVQVTFPVASTAWGSVAYSAIFDAVTGGNMLMYAALTSPVTINASDPPVTFAVGALDIKEN